MLKAIPVDVDESSRTVLDYHRVPAPTCNASSTTQNKNNGNINNNKLISVADVDTDLNQPVNRNRIDGRGTY